MMLNFYKIITDILVFNNVLSYLISQSHSDQVVGSKPQK